MRLSNESKTKLQIAIEWIALNDEPLELERGRIAGYISTCLIADVFGVSTDYIARRVLRIRNTDKRGA